MACCGWPVKNQYVVPVPTGDAAAALVAAAGALVAAAGALVAAAGALVAAAGALVPLLLGLLELLQAATPATTGTLIAAKPRNFRRDIPF
jgi:hypothetical protein